MRLGEACAHADEFVDAEKVLRKALAAGAGADGRRLLGLAILELGRPDEAADEFERALPLLESKADTRAVATALHKIYKDAGRPADAARVAADAAG